MNERETLLSTSELNAQLAPDPQLILVNVPLGYIPLVKKILDYYSSSSSSVY
jgi:hypothetical protein